MNAWRLAVGAECQGCAVQVGRSSGVSDGGGGLSGKMGGGSRKKVYTRNVSRKYSPLVTFFQFGDLEVYLCLLYRADRTSDERAKSQRGCMFHSLYMSESGGGVEFTLPD